MNRLLFSCRGFMNFIGDKKAGKPYFFKVFRLFELASQRGFEPPAPRLGGVCSIQLSY